MEFFTVVDPRVSLRGLVRKGVITQDICARIDAAYGDNDAREILYYHLQRHANVDTLREYCEVAMSAYGFPRMQALGRKMMEELPLEGWLELSTCVRECCGYICATLWTRSSLVSYTVHPIHRRGSTWLSQDAGTRGEDVGGAAAKRPRLVREMYLLHVGYVFTCTVPKACVPASVYNMLSTLAGTLVPLVSYLLQCTLYVWY